MFTRLLDLLLTFFGAAHLFHDHTNAEGEGSYIVYIWLANTVTTIVSVGCSAINMQQKYSYSYNA